MNDRDSNDNPGGGFSVGHNGGPDFIYGSAGWVALHRGIRNHWLVGFGQAAVRAVDPLRGTFSRAEAFIDLIMEARWQGQSVMNGGRKMDLRPGQLLGAVSWLAHRWNWSPKTVRGFLDKLEDDGTIRIDVPGAQKGNISSVITICNYEEYQMLEQQQGQTEGKQRANEGQMKGNNRNKETREQGNKEREEREGGFALAADAAPLATDALQAFEDYNALAQRIGLPIARTLTPQRRKLLLARLREHGGMAAWGVALRNVERSAFLRGTNGRGWRADLDFLLQASRFAKVVDGTYGNGAHAAPAETEFEKLNRLMGVDPSRPPENIEILPPLRRM